MLVGGVGFELFVVLVVFLWVVVVIVVAEVFG